MSPLEKLPETSTSTSGEVHHKFTAWLPDELLGHKIDGFITDFRAKVLRLSRDHVKLRVGQRAALSLWHNSFRVPVDVDLRFEPGQAPNPSLYRVHAQLTPRTRKVGDREIQSDCLRIIRGLRMCLLANSPEQSASA